MDLIRLRILAKAVNNVQRVKILNGLVQVSQYGNKKRVQYDYW